jgi:hypothetical protein
MLHQEVMHRPEGALACCYLGGLGGELGVWVDILKREVPPHIPDIAEVPQQLTDDRLRLATERAIEVRILDKGD